MSGKFALIIGNTEYTDPGLAQLTAPGKDAEDFAHILNDKEICAFNEVNTLLNQPEHIIRRSIDEFFDQKKPDDLLILYFSGHGVRDEHGALFLAVKNTDRSRLRSTAIKSDFIREAMDQSRSKRQVLILDCCNSGAFLQGAKAATGASIGTASAFEAGYGRIILTASDATQFAWEGDNVIGETQNSLFTHFLVKGLAGEADLDSDGSITVDELYDYAYEKVRLATPKQTPSKFSTKQQGEIVLRQFNRIEDIKPISLPDQLLSEIENPYPEVRLRAVGQLIKILNGKNLGLARSAREVLEKTSAEDDSRRVVQAAEQALDLLRQREQKVETKTHEETEPVLEVPKVEERKSAPVKPLVKPKVEFRTTEDTINRQVKTVSNPIIIQRSLLLHLLSGTGLFQIGSQSLAKWLYPLAFLLMVIGFCVSPPLDLDYRLWQADLVRDGIAGIVGYISLFVYFIGFVDTWISFGNKTLQKSLLWHLASGRGLLYTDSHTRRRWLYPLAFLVMIVGFSLCPPLDLDVKLWKHDIISDSFAATTGYVCLFIYLIGFIDTWLSLTNKFLQKSLVPQLLSGTGLFFSDSQPVRRWLYFSGFVLIIAAFSICPPLDLDSKLWNFDLVPDLVAGIVGYISLIIYFVGIYDTYISYKKGEVARVVNVTL